jgi:hypothetical protein
MDLEKALIKLKNAQSMLEKKRNNMAIRGEELRQLQQELAKEPDKKWRLEEIMQATSEELNRYKNELHQYKVALVQFIDQFEQERLKYHTVMQNMECKIQKEKRDLNVQLSEYKRRNRRLKDMLSEQKQKHEIQTRLTRKCSMQELT